MKIIKLTLAFASSMLVVACGEVSQEAETSEIIKPVKLFKVQSENVKHFRSFHGEVIASNQADLSFKVAGPLIEVAVSEGDEVKKGDLLAQLDKTDYQIQVDLAEANYKLSKAQYDRVKAAATKNAATASQLDEAAAGLSQSEINLKNARNQLTYTRLDAPYDGTVGIIYVDEQEFIGAARPVLNLLSLDTIDLQFNIPSDIVSAIDPNQKNMTIPVVRFDAQPEASYNAQVKGFIASADPGTRSYSVLLSMPKPDSSVINVLPGMNATLDFDLNTIRNDGIDGMFVPIEAVFSQGQADVASSEKQVWRFTDGQVELVNVMAGVIEGNTIEIESGLQPGDQIVIAGVHSLHEGQQVKPWITNGGN